MRPDRDEGMSAPANEGGLLIDPDQSMVQVRVAQPHREATRSAPEGGPIPLWLATTSPRAVKAPPTGGPPGRP